MEDMQPGNVISPQDTPTPPNPTAGMPEPDRPPEQPQPVPAPSPPAEPLAAIPANPYSVAGNPVPAAPQPVASATYATAPAQTDQWQFTQESDPGSSFGAEPMPHDDLNWTAAEFIAHEKSTGWYAMLAAAGVVLVALVYLVSRDIISSAIVTLTIAIFGVYAARKPRTLQYGLSRAGLQIDKKLYGFHDFKSFSITEEGAIASLIFMPLKRFGSPLTIYVAPEMEDRVVDFVADYLPVEQHQSDALDSLLRRIHF